MNRVVDRAAQRESACAIWPRWGRASQRGVALDRLAPAEQIVGTRDFVCQTRNGGNRQQHARYASGGEVLELREIVRHANGDLNRRGVPARVACSAAHRLDQIER